MTQVNWAVQDGNAHLLVACGLFPQVGQTVNEGVDP